MGLCVLAVMLAGEAVKTFPLSLVMISSSISFLAGVLSFSKIRNLQSLCKRSSWTLVVQAGEGRNGGEEGHGAERREREEMSRRGRRRRSREEKTGQWVRSRVSCSHPQELLRSTLGIKDSLPCWLGLVMRSWVDVRSPEPAYGAASHLNVTGSLVNGQSTPLSGRPFFN